VVRHRVSAPLGASLIVGSSVLYASYGVWTTLMGDFFGGGYATSALRSALVLAIFVGAAAVTGQMGGFSLRTKWRWWAGALGASVLMWGPFYYAILHEGIGVALSMNYGAYIVGTFAFARIVLRERFTKDKWLATGLSFAGLYLLFTPNLAAVGWVALGAACVSGVSFGAINIVLKGAPYGVMKSNVMMWSTSLVANILMAVVVGQRVPAAGWDVRWVFLGLFAISSIVSSLMYVGGLKLIEAGAAGVLGLLEVVFGLVLGVVSFGQHVTIIALVGVVFILGAAAIPYVKDYNARRGTLEGAKS